MDLRKALDTTRRIVRAAGQGKGAAPLAYVEAATLARSSDQRARAVADAAVRVARAADPVAAAQEIAAAFLCRPVVASSFRAEALEGSEAAATVSVAFSSVRRGLESSDPDPAEMGAAVRVLGDAMRELGDALEPEDVLLAADVIAEATLRSVALADLAARTAEQLLDRARKSRQPIERDTLHEAARTIRGAIHRAGSVGVTRHPNPSSAILEKAVADGADVAEADAVARFCREFDELSASCSIPSMPRDRYVELCLARWRLNRNDPHAPR